MEKTKAIEELKLLDEQIQQTVQDIGRLSSFSQSSGGAILSQVKEEKMKALRFLREKRIRILNSEQ